MRVTAEDVIQANLAKIERSGPATLNCPLAQAGRRTFGMACHVGHCSLRTADDRVFDMPNEEGLIMLWDLTGLMEPHEVTLHEVETSGHF